MSKKIRIALADDHHILLRSLTKTLKREVDIEVVASAPNGRELLDKMKLNEVDIVILDLDMPIMDGRAVLPILKLHYSKVKVIILSSHDSLTHMRKFLNEGASAYLSKSVDYNVLLNAIRSVNETGYFLYGKVTKALLADLKFGDQKKLSVIEGDPLTARESEIVNLICEGMTNCQIADILSLSKRTIENHRMRISKKIGTNCSAKIVVFAIANGIYDVNK